MTPSSNRPALLERIGATGLGVLVTLKRDGRPQLSNITYVYDGERVRISLTADRAKTKNLRRDPRASVYINENGGRAYLVLEGNAELTPVAADPNDEVVDELVDYYRKGSGEHPDWDEYRATMVQDKRLLFSMNVEHAYGMPSPS